MQYNITNKPERWYVVKDGKLVATCDDQETAEQILNALQTQWALNNIENAESATDDLAKEKK